MSFFKILTKNKSEKHKLCYKINFSEIVLASIKKNLYFMENFMFQINKSHYGT